MSRWVLIEEHGENGIRDGIFCTGVFDNVETAIGHAMNAIWDLKDSYRGEGDEFTISEPENTEGECGFCIYATFKADCWDKPCTHYWYILDADDEKEKK